MTTLVFVDRETPAWNRVWGLLQASTGGDTVQRCGCGCGEVWQYMGSYRAGGRTAHEFRHRHHPLTRQREYRRFTEAPVPEGPEVTGRMHELQPVHATLSPEARALVALVTARRDV